MTAKSISVENPCKQSQAKPPESTELEGFAQALIRSAGTGIYVVQEGKFQYVNALFEKLTGYTQEELLGTYSLNLVHPEDRQIVRKKAIENLKGRQSPFPYEYRFIKKGGDILWVLERVTSTEYRGKRAAVGSFMDIVERKHKEEVLQEMATIDVLTGLNNRRAILHRLDEEIKRATRYREELGLLMLDIDHFKKVNDQYGHLTGDDVLEKVATLVRQNIRGSDTAGRYGGEEFVIILPKTDLSPALVVAERIRKTIEMAEMKDSEGNVFGITVSLGLSLYRPDEDEYSFISRVDNALYKAKENGRNRVETAALEEKSSKILAGN